MRIRPRLAMPAGVACLLLLPAVIPAQDVAKRAARPVLPDAKAEQGKVEAIMKNVEGLIRVPGEPPRVVPAQQAEAVRAQRVRANIDAIAQQQVSLLRPILRSEYQLFLLAAEPTKESRRAVAREGERALSEASKKFAEWQMGLRPGGTTIPPDPRLIVQDALVAAAEANLPPDRAARYREERDKRAANLKRTALHNLVAKLDQNLFLSEEQAESIASALDANWETAWTNSFSQFFNDNAYFFPIPDRLILPTLGDSQKKAWIGLQKVQNHSYTTAFIGNRGVADLRPLEDAELDVPPEPARVLPRPE